MLVTTVIADVLNFMDIHWRRIDMKKVLHFSGLNGIRALAALCVVFTHITLELKSFGLNAGVFGTHADGTPITHAMASFGVSIFFALSGFLITYLLLEEKKTTETVSVKNFYIRRMLRIWPLYYGYLIITLIVLLVNRLPIDNGSVPLYVFFSANIAFIVGDIYLLSHYWSLGVEEQFYAFWPWIIKKSKSWLLVTIVICGVLVLLKIIFRIIDIKIYDGVMSWPTHFLQVTRFPCMLIGAIGAMLYYNGHKLFMTVVNSWIAQLACWVAILLVVIGKFHIISFLDNEFISVVAVGLIVGQIEKKHRIINLETPFLNFVGKISYGIYVIHPLVIFCLAKLFNIYSRSAAIVMLTRINLMRYTMTYVSVFFVTITLAFVSYEIFEKRFLSMKDKYSAVKSTGTSPEPTDAEDSEEKAGSTAIDPELSNPPQPS